VNTVRLIQQKRDGGRHTDDELAALIRGYVAGEIPDYQLSAWAMAVYFRGMDVDETAGLTRAMLESGEQLKWPAGTTLRADKHSTGGVGDKISLVLAPLLAGLGFTVPMISGRGLGATGGTLDKLESIPGFRTDLALADVVRIAREAGCVMTGQTSQLVPADKKLYALRDVTGTVPSIPLITASILSKKVAEGLDGLVLDVKCGSGAFMKDVRGARALAESLSSVGSRLGVKVRARLSDMSQPLGRMVGNLVEVLESLEVLAGGGPADVRQLTLTLAADVCLLLGAAGSHHEGLSKSAACLDSGEALRRFERMVGAQGGRLDKLAAAAPMSEIVAPRSGYVARMETESIGQAVIALGGGRRVMSDVIDHRVGLEMLCRLGDPVRAGQPVARMFALDRGGKEARALILEALVIADEPAEVPPLLLE
jgi:pyrimidine-nucleoside phosphorylase